jgi:hypothetical protein
VVRAKILDNYFFSFLSDKDSIGNFNCNELLMTLIHKLVVISVLIVMWYGGDSVVKYCMNKRWFVWLSAFAFMIYVVHAPFIVYATKAIFLQINHWYGYRMLTYVFLPIFILILSVLIGSLMRKFMPVVYSFVTGGRGLK